MKKRLLYFLIVLGSMFGAGSVKATTYYWAGYINNNWNQVGNWANAAGFAIGGFPVAGDIVNVGVGAVPVPIRSLTVNTASNCTTLNLGGTYTTTVTMSSTLNVSGTITTDGTVTITGASLLSGASLVVSANDTFNIDAPLTISGASTVATGSTVTTTKVFSTATMSTTNSTFSIGAAMSITGNSGTTLNFVSGTNTFNTSSFLTTLSSGGSAVVTAGAVTLGSPVTITSGSLSLTAGSLTANAAVTLSNGALNMAASTTLTANAAVSANGAVNINGSCTITGTNTVSGTSLPFSGAYTLTAGATLINISGSSTMNNNCTVTFVNNASAGSPTLTIGGGISNGSTATLTFNATNPGTANITGNIAAIGGGTFAVGSGATLNLASGTQSQSYFGYTWTNAGTINVASTFTINYNQGGATFNNSGTIVCDGNMTFTGTFVNSGSITQRNGNTFTIGANSSNFTNTGTVTITPSASTPSKFTVSGSNCAFSNTYVSAAQPGVINITGLSSSSATVFNEGSSGSFSNSGTITASYSPILLNGNVLSPINNSGTITLATSPLTISNNSSTFNNTGSIAATASPLNLGSTSNGVNFNNTSPGTMTLLSGSDMTFPGNSCTFANTGTLTVNSSDVNFISNVNKITNTSPGVITANNSDITFATGCGLINNASAIFTANGGSTISFTAGSSQSYITNAGIFNAGTSSISGASTCAIAPVAGAFVKIDNNSGGVFNLGAGSSITLKTNNNSNPSSVNNNGTGKFTLESDQNGSASFGASGTPSVNTPGNNNQITGTYNVQRYISGGVGTRGYRLLSSPVNSSSITTGTIISTSPGNMSFANINATGSAITITNGNAIAGTVNVPGALTGGPSGTTNGFSVANTNPTLYIYDETKAHNSGTFTGGKTIGIAIINGSGAVKTLTGTTTSASTISIPVTTGYMLYFIGNTTSNTTASSRVPEATVLTHIGTINQTDIKFTLWNTGVANLSWAGPEAVASRGYNLVGNPYPSTIWLRQLYLDNVGGSNSWVNFAAVKNLSTSQTNFAYYNASTQIGSDPSFTGYIASGQAFYLQANGASQTVTFKETAKSATIIGTSTTPPLLMSTPKSQEVLAANGMSFNAANPSKVFSQSDPISNFGLLHLKLEKDSLLDDWCAIAFSKAWKDDYDSNDAYDLDGIEPKVFMSSYTADGVRTGINMLNEIGAGKTIKLFVKSKTDGMYSLKMPDVNNIDLGTYKITLLDHYKKDSLDIGKHGVYNFNITNADTTTFGGERFELSIKPIPGPKYQLASFTAQKANDGVLVTWRALNESNNYAYTLEKQEADGTTYAPVYQTQSNGGNNYKYTDKTPNTGNNVYRLKQVDLFGNITYAGPVNIYYDKSGNNNMFSVYPNPTAETLNVNVTYGKTNTTAALSYKLNIYDITGSVVMQKTTENSSFSQNVSKFKPGVYIVELQDNEGSSLGKTKFVKK